MSSWDLSIATVSYSVLPLHVTVDPSPLSPLTFQCSVLEIRLEPSIADILGVC